MVQPLDLIPRFFFFFYCAPVFGINGWNENCAQVFFSHQQDWTILWSGHFTLGEGLKGSHWLQCDGKFPPVSPVFVVVAWISLSGSNTFCSCYTEVSTRTVDNSLLVVHKAFNITASDDKLHIAAVFPRRCRKEIRTWWRRFKTSLHISAAI